MQSSKKSKRIRNSILCCLIIAVLIVTNVPLLSSAGEDSPNKNAKTTTGEGIELKDVIGEIKGNLVLPDSMTDVNVLLYKQEDYEEPEENNNGIIDKEKVESDKNIYDKAKVEKDGKFEFKEVEFGSYRINFLSYDKDFDAKSYELDKESIKSEPENIKVKYADDKLYFAYADIDFEESSTLDFKINESKKETDDPKKPTLDEEKPQNEDKPEKEALSSDGAVDESSSDSAISDTQAEEPDDTDKVKDKDITTENAIDKDTEKILNEVSEDAALSINELKKNDEETVGATVEKAGFLKRLGSSILSLVTGSEWSFDMYYIGQDDKHHVEKTSDFSLKYQMEFHTSRDVSAGAIDIRVPADSFLDRSGKPIVPTDFAIPMGTPGNPVQTSVSPFNYYFDSDTNELVFFNYKGIKSGANAAWQVMYKNVQVMEITDETTWTLQAKVSVDVVDPNGDVVTETETPDPLTGKINTKVNLSSVTKTTNNITGKSYGPGLYTKNQVKSYVGTMPEEYENNFNDYVYVLWKVTVKGDANQPWNLLMKDTTDNGGSVVGISGLDATKTNEEGYITASAFSKNKTFNYTYNVVTAYPKADTPEGKVLKNTIDVKLQPYDKVDPEQQKSDSAEWSYKDYVWVYNGDVIGVQKYTPDKNKSKDLMKGWLSVYEGYKNAGKDKGSFTYSSYSTVRSYGLTHYTTGANKGIRIPSTTVTATTVDDILYVHSSKDAGNPVMLSDEDYYFNSVDISVTDRGYDIFEDTSAAPEKSGPADIYVMYAGKTEWTKIKTVDWVSSGNLNYTLTADDLKGQPYRVKVVHDTINYISDCRIGVKVTIRHDSPIFEQLMKEDPTSITVQNISGVIGEYNNNGNISEFHSKSEENYKQYPNELKTKTTDLYGYLIQRDSAQVDVTTLNETSGSSKTASASNDVINGRVNVRYNLTANDGYEIYSKDGVNDIMTYRDDILKPGRKEVMFYDLLPYGVQYDPSQALVAGRTTNMDTYKEYTRRYQLWDQTQAKVSVDKIITNYNGTGRTFVAFKVTYDGADPSFYSSNLWLEGWGVSFGAYYDWKNVDVVDREPNIAAFMPAVNDNERLLGTPYQDNGTVPSDTYSDFGPDIDKDGDQDEKNVLYANATAYENILVASQSKIEKLVKADDDQYSTFETVTAVEGTRNYTYDITVYNATGIVKDIVVFDRLENAAVDRKDIEPGKFENEGWHGTFNGLQLRALDDLGITYKVYYNKDRNAELPKENALPSSVLDESKGWFEASEFLKTNKLSDVKAFAVDISKKEGDQDFTLESLESVSFRVNMTAPDASDMNWAYNSASFYRYSVTNDEGHSVEGNSNKVRLNGVNDLEVKKNLADNTPDTVMNNKFEFTISRDGEPLRNIGYTLYNKDGDSWKKVDKLNSTDADGKFSITASQKVIFEKLVSADDVTVVETESPFWKVNEDVDDSKLESDGIRTITFTNTYQPILYAQKVLANVPSDTDVKDDEFTFKLLANGKAVANTKFYYVESVRTDGGIPKIEGTGQTDKDGKFVIRQGEIIALLPGEVGVEYTLSEVGGAGDDDRWFVEKDTVTGTLAVKGSSASITNYYKLKNLLLTKEITNQDPAECTQEFTFQVLDSDNNPVTGNKWVVLDSEGKETSEEGVLDEDGKFKTALAGKTVKITGLTAGKTYTIKETESGALYKAVNDGVVSVEMPKYGDNRTATITNDYLKRPLSVTKQVLYDLKDKAEAVEVAKREFTMIAKVDGKVLANTDYVVYENGKQVDTGTTEIDGNFTLKHGQTATFYEVAMKDTAFEVTETPDGDYPQVYPVDNKSHTGTLSQDQNNVTFINGKPGSLILEKIYDGKDELSNTMVEEIKTDPTLRKQMAVTLTMQVTSGSETYTYPKANTNVTVIDSITGETSLVTWMKGQSIIIEPWKKVVINDLDGADSYRLSESIDDQKRIYEYNSNWMQIQQTIPGINQSATGTVNSDPIATIQNSINTISLDGSEIFKYMKKGSSAVPEGSVLTWRVEEYDGSTWSPKSGVSYLTFDDNGATCSEVLTTDNNGSITLTKTADGYPRVKFIEDNVKLNVTEGVKGDLRVVEVLSESDDEWGQLSGYKKDDKEGIAVEDADGFVNSNLLATVELAKIIDKPSDSTFTFILSQITKANDPIALESDIKETVVQGGIAYTIYDQESNQQVGTGMTTANGEITIKGGQYVKINLPNGTYWTLTEKVVKPYNLTDLNLSNPTDEMMHFVKDDKGDNVSNLVVINPYVKVKGVYVGDHGISPAPSDEGKRQWPDAKPITLTQPMARAGVTDARTGQHVDLWNEDIIEIPKYIIYGDEVRIITAIGETGPGKGSAYWTFYRNRNIVQVRLPNSIKTIGYAAFCECTSIIGGINLPEGLEIIDECAFTGNSTSYTKMKISGDLIIPDSVKQIRRDAFSMLPELGPDVYIGSGVTSIYSNAFSQSGVKTINIDRKTNAINGAPWGAGTPFPGYSRWTPTVNWTGTK